MNKCLRITFVADFPEGFLQSFIQKNAKKLQLEGIAQVMAHRPFLQTQGSAHRTVPCRKAPGGTGHLAGEDQTPRGSFRPSASREVTHVALQVPQFGWIVIGHSVTHHNVSYCNTEAW